MPQFTVDVDVLRHALQDHSLSQTGDDPLQVKITSPFHYEGLTFSPTATLAVRVMNAASDRDADGVFSGKEDAQVPYAAQSAWIKYTLSAKAAGKISFAPAGATAQSDIALSDYRIHGATDDAFGAVVSDLRAPRTLLDLDDVRALQPGEALSMELGGSLGASVTMSWSDVLSTQLSDILSEITPRVPIGVRIQSGLEVSVAVKVTDQFAVTASRTSDGHYRFAVKKTASRNHDYGISVDAGIDLSGAPAIDEVLDAIVAAITKTKTARPIDDLRAQLRKRLVAAAQWKASAGFAYEYARVDENTSIADFVLLDDARLANDYALVMNGDFAQIAATLRTDTSAHTIIRYLTEQTVSRKQSFGFSLGIGKWVDVKALDQSTFTQSTRTSLDGFRLVTCRGTRKYEEKNIPQNDFEWIVDLKAQMKEFVVAPTTLDFDYGLSVLATLDRGAMSQGDLDRMLDFAAMWDVCVPDASEFAEALGKRCSVRLQLVFDRETLLATLAQQSDVASWSAPLAMGMPYSSTFPERRTCDARRDTYAPAWEAWLRNAPWKIDARSGLAIVEQQGGVGSFAWICGEGHPQLRKRLDVFVNGARALHELMTNAQSPDAIGDAYQSLEGFWSQRLYVAALGRWLLDRAAEAGVTPNATLQVEFPDATVTS